MELQEVSTVEEKQSLHDSLAPPQELGSLLMDTANLELAGWVLDCVAEVHGFTFITSDLTLEFFPYANLHLYHLLINVMSLLPPFTWSFTGDCSKN